MNQSFAFWIAMTWLVTTGCLSQAQASPDMSCDRAAALVENSLDIPQGLLVAIARVESNNQPLAVNVNGLSVSFSRQDLAVDAVKTMLKSGAFGSRPHVDIGCFQINLGWHSDAFPSIEAGFDPVTNGLAAGLFLRNIHARTGSWHEAVARYHAASQAGSRYAEAVFRKYEGRSGQRATGYYTSPEGEVPPLQHDGRSWVKTASAYGITVFEPDTGR
ncbi:transglycosylase SLT domain-containing protein [Acetobacter sp.]|uniref:transglycosylase SLT domain-containing protein n=1 Tax=Acetobacter sp. TaxID=440 RepID=UPI0025BB6C54|nr:transglycosylase SLT domain-containing protein [Acetobacter sp.]MCH4090057.1 transglycosylase SLT domain-containing protein [Acetobacter sp.]MCI1298753.1 transglycosylase SLT domain-containing protein [Acetobacter sp.]MCI1315318.1 transglycosylase SLT domain-containing protein [Acetobacter sp.]